MADTFIQVDVALASSGYDCDARVIGTCRIEPVCDGGYRVTLQDAVADGEPCVHETVARSVRQLLSGDGRFQWKLLLDVLPAVLASEGDEEIAAGDPGCLGDEDPDGGWLFEGTEQELEELGLLDTIREWGKLDSTP